MKDKEMNGPARVCIRRVSRRAWRGQSGTIGHIETKDSRDVKREESPFPPPSIIRVPGRTTTTRSRSALASYPVYFVAVVERPKRIKDGRVVPSVCSAELLEKERERQRGKEKERERERHEAAGNIRTLTGVV